MSHLLFHFHKSGLDGKHTLLKGFLFFFYCGTPGIIDTEVSLMHAHTYRKHTHCEAHASLDTNKNTVNHICAHVVTHDVFVSLSLNQQEKLLC